MPDPRIRICEPAPHALNQQDLKEHHCPAQAEAAAVRQSETARVRVERAADMTGDAMGRGAPRQDPDRDVRPASPVPGTPVSSRHGRPATRKVPAGSAADAVADVGGLGGVDHPDDF
jgi:hypothetical protein